MVARLPVWVMVTVMLGVACATVPTTVESPASAAAPDAGSDAELASAFDAPAEKVVVKPQRPPEEPKVDRSAAYKTAIAEVQAALKGKKLDEARAAATRAMSEAVTLDGEARLSAHQFAHKVEMTAGDAAAAEAAARAWLLACGPEKLDACRSAALAGLLASARVKGADKGLAKEADELKKAEQCAAKAESQAKAAPCENDVARLARAGRDVLLEQRLMLGQALRETDAGKQVKHLERAEGHCTTPQCSGLRRRALMKLLALARAKEDVDGAVKLALREVEVVSATVPENERIWARTGSLDQTCVSYDTAHGAGSCRALERKTLNRWTFHDYSKDSSGAEGLTADQVRVVNDHFAPLIQECLAEQAKRMTPPDAQRFEVRWVVFNDGRVGEAHLRRDLDETPLAKCLRAQFVTWRYPKYEGEFQNVEQAFTVTANERRFR